jgi:hypothetical protein
LKTSTIVIILLLAGLVFTVATFLPRLIEQIKVSNKQTGDLNAKAGAFGTLAQNINNIFSVFQPSEPGMTN